jgi:hypothetical protein
MSPTRKRKRPAQPDATPTDAQPDAPSTEGQRVALRVDPAAGRVERVVLPPLTVAEQVQAELARQRRDEQIEAAQRQAERAGLDKYAGGPCSVCGVSHCAQVLDVRPEPTRMVPGWTNTDEGPTCVECYQRYFQTPGLTADARRVRMLLDAIGRKTMPMLAETEPHRFADVPVLFRERSGATPSMEPWAHIDRVALAEAFEAVLHPAPPPPVAPETDAPCPSCGVSTAWVAWAVDDGNGGTLKLYRCSGCWAPPGGRHHVDQVVSDRLAPLTGRPYVGGVAKALGLALWEDSGRRQPNVTPFGAWYSEGHKAHEMGIGYAVASSSSPKGELLRPT